MCYYLFFFFPLNKNNNLWPGKLKNKIKIKKKRDDINWSTKAETRKNRRLLFPALCHFFRLFFTTFHLLAGKRRTRWLFSPAGIGRDSDYSNAQRAFLSSNSPAHFFSRRREICLILTVINGDKFSSTTVS